MKKLLKKSILFIMLLLTCIVFTGCAGNSDSYNDSDVSTLKVTVDKNLINGSNSSERASYDLNNLNLYFNGVLFQGHSLDSDGNFVFTNVMYTQIAQDKLYKKKYSTIKISVGEIKNPDDDEIVMPYTIEFANIDLPADLHIYLNNKLVGMTNQGNQVHIKSVNGEDEGYEDPEKITKVKYEKYNNNNLTAKVTFYNAFNESKDIGEYNSYSWQITIKNPDSGNIVSWTSEDNKSSKYLDIQKEGSEKNPYYIIYLTSLGKDKIGNHTLDDTNVKIDYIKNGSDNVVDPSVLQKGTWE